MADRHVAEQRAELVLVEHLRNEALVADRHDPATARSGRDAGGLLPGASPNSSTGASTLAPIAPAMQHSAKATAKPPSAMSCALFSAPARTASRTLACASRTACSSLNVSGPTGGSPRSFASSEPAS